MTDGVNQEATQEEATTNEATTPSTPNEDNIPANPWEEAFPGKSPEDVLKETNEWKQHSREWEKRAKSWKKQVDNNSPKEQDFDELNSRVEHTESRLSEAQAENGMFRDLIALEIESGNPVPISQLADSIAFRNAYDALDREADDFADKLQEIVDKRAPKTTAGIQRQVEVGQEESSGIDLYQRMFNKEKEN
ncbi:hypothetical protein HMPREF1261_02250 [Corynebacterium sp. KPL1818]|uniref:hypothetical protein n=1 Tax=Corynebacterium sp. KPL1818 TaxID=1203559 RepID=UPI0003B9167E|nr:hypothetical protein [Corynebacterium sp. KPL1818]ERS57577.1 hypothetical protein HMPREF1261_02250 [Corynebacterium sp. KPL1818]